jgi:hypothetical protein
MTPRTLSHRPAHAGSTWEVRLVLASVLVLSGLAVADRLTAWLIGQFPTYAALWRLRFEFLRPIGVYYDMVERNFGALSAANFSALALAAAALIAAGVVSRRRLARAIACHLLLAAALTLAYISWDPGHGLRPHVRVGMTSQSYALLGISFALVSGALCLRIHAEYVGWNPASSRAFRRARVATLRFRMNVDAFIADVADQLSPAPRRLRAVLAAARVTRRRQSDR